MVDSFWSLIPPVLAILMVLFTRRVLLSLGIGIIASALFIANFHLMDTIMYIWQASADVFVEEGGVNTWNVYILLFVLILGMMTALITKMGGTSAFGEWMIKRVKTRVGAQLMTMFLGIIFFIDDYFNSLTVGQIAGPVTDQHRISRAKLAYIVDSTGAPVCVVAPISSWGAYIISLIGTVFVTHNYVSYSELGAFLRMIPMNYYVWAALGVVLIISVRQVDFGPMRTHEKRALETEKTGNTDNHFMEKKTTSVKSTDNRKVYDLFIPLAVLFVTTIGFIFGTGYVAVDGKKTLIAIFGEADVSQSLFVGGLAGLIMTSILFIRHLAGKRRNGHDFLISIVKGAKSMLPAFLILIFAWVISDLIADLGTGAYLADLVKQSNIHFAWLPFLVFLIAGFIAFSTGTSWGSFALLFPIAGQIAATTDMELMLPMLAAVLAGAVFGDHSSPISDTTILSSTGANCHHIDHVTTQLPYAFTAAGIAGISYLGFGFSGNYLVGLLIMIIGLVIFDFILRYYKKRLMYQDNEEIKQQISR